MSSKAIVAIIAVGGVLATTPFYLSGFFAHKAISQQLKDSLAQFNDTAIIINNEMSELGLYQSGYSYDIVFNLDSTELLPFKELIGKPTATLHIDHVFKHGFMSISGDLKYSGELVDIISQKAQANQFTKANPEQPLTTTTLEADFSLAGHYQMKVNTATQAFTMINETPSAGIQTIKFSAQTSKFVGTPEKINGNFIQPKIEFINDINQIAVNNLIVNGSATLQLDRTLNEQIWQDQKITVNVADVEFTESGNVDKVLDNFLFTYLINVDDKQRLHADIEYTFDKAGFNAMPMSKIENFSLGVDSELGYKAFKNYYDQFKAMTNPANPSDPEVAIDIFSKLLTEDIQLNIKSLKAGTFAGPIDLTGNLDLKAVEVASFKQNPMQALANLSYALKGEMPQDLINMIGQIPPEAIDNFVAQEMLTLKDGQIFIDLTGEAGHVNLNGKPLM